MIPITSYKDRKLAVFGLGESGLAASFALMEGGASISAWDDSSDKVANAKRKGVRTLNLKQADWSEFDALVLSPGVPLTHPTPHWSVGMARKSKIEVFGDIELLVRERQHSNSSSKLVAITGTNGKSTTTAMIAHILEASGYDVQMGGNIGTPVLSLKPLADSRVYVLECSSFQIDLTPGLKPSVGILLNLSPDHLDRHGSFEKYARLKARLVKSSKTAVIGIDSEETLGIASEIADSGSDLSEISEVRDVRNGIRVQGRVLHLMENGRKSHFADLSETGSLRGSHNMQNAAAAAMTCLRLGVCPNAIQESLKTFPGLVHRMEEVGRDGSVLFINDSKATNADAAAKALSSFENIHWIAGGREKNGGIGELQKYFPHIAKAYLIGEAALNFAKALEGHLPYGIYGTLKNAVSEAYKDANASGIKHPVVLLSPACASFDQFRSFGERGDAFRKEVMKLIGHGDEGGAK